MMSTVLLEKFDGFAIVTLHRPEAMNALSRELRSDFVSVFNACTEDRDIRVIILTGSGKAFCAGFDLKELGSSDTTNTAEEADNGVARAMETFNGPIIGAINGHCITGGFEMALACDILIASENARFADTHARVGMLPGWGLSQKLPRLIGLSRAREIAFTGAPIFAQQAYEWGLVNHVVTGRRVTAQGRQNGTGHVRLRAAGAAAIPNPDQRTVTPCPSTMHWNGRKRERSGGQNTHPAR